MTDPGTADRTYIGPMAPELVEEIIAKARHSQVYDLTVRILCTLS